MNFVIITFALKLAFVPIQTNLIYPSDFSFQRCNTENYFYIDFYADIEIKELFFISGRINVPVFQYTDSFYFYPFALGSLFSAGFRYSIFELGYSHYCIHPVVPSYHMNHSIQYEGSHDEIYIEIKGHI
jgi:hypothetical protein